MTVKEILLAVVVCIGTYKLLGDYIPQIIKAIVKCFKNLFEHIREQKNSDRKKFTDWLKNEAEDCGLCDPPLEPQKAISFLRDYLLGEGWYIAISESQEQVNTAIVFEILSKYSSDFRREWKKYIKKE